VIVIGLIWKAVCELIHTCYWAITNQRDLTSEQ
jgi:hypothetical protein